MMFAIIMCKISNVYQPWLLIASDLMIETFVHYHERAEDNGVVCTPYHNV